MHNILGSSGESPRNSVVNVVDLCPSDPSSDPECFVFPNCDMFSDFIFEVIYFTYIDFQIKFYENSQQKRLFKLKCNYNFMSINILTKGYMNFMT